MRHTFKLCKNCREQIGNADKVAILENAGTKDAHLYVEYDAHDDGELSSSETWGLGHDFIPVRIQILAGTPPADVMRTLRRLTAWLKETYRDYEGRLMRPAQALEPIDLDALPF